MVIDFSTTKAVFGSWLDSELDHTAILNAEDKQLIEVVNLVHANAGKKPVHVVNFEPTSENLAFYFQEKAQELLEPHRVVVSRVRVFETPNCWSDSEVSSLVLNKLLSSIINR
jgi:6-pyruvoyltetrahydropterin/6-carboxytetrahydropterin synthase